MSVFLWVAGIGAWLSAGVLGAWFERRFDSPPPFMPVLSWAALWPVFALLYLVFAGIPALNERLEALLNPNTTTNSEL